MKQQCLTCGGQYHDVLPDGTLYFHVCPPLNDREIVAALQLPADRSTWTRAQRLAFAAADRTRPHARNENRPSTAPGAAGRLIAAGAGVSAVKA